ncbi:CobW family GTP-binding protein [Microbulbifer agarilyticus]|uniref:CobW family GTP-binding protein n=1 Tax=Microbulbifer agarilyticus TaxID=260552 RepID=UPI001CD3867F|nr:GTP-binding protein [Microbulbifer agarilyticus]MCA0892825.1 GTP-binding protein [Microbulbifer agarilyticus]
MGSEKAKISAVPTNIITGFLGAGKTSTILHLLKSKPANERWAVLVNEFGEIGIDGSLFQGTHREEDGVFIREVPGGCMCCAAGLPMQIALNQLLTRAKPDRLLIEPTGLGHPIEVLETLSAEHYKDVLSIQKILTLVDARKLADERYTSHKTFNQQIAIADIVVGNKQDLYGEREKAALQEYVKEHSPNATEVLFSEQGQIDFSILSGPTATRVSPHYHESHGAPSAQEEAEIPQAGFVKAVNQGESYQSVGWRFAPDIVFDQKKLFNFLSGLTVERMKAVFITDEGVLGYNLTPDTLTEVELDDCAESRIEIIAQQLEDEWEAQLMQCQLPNG